MSVFSAAELAYLAEGKLGRLSAAIVTAGTSTLSACSSFTVLLASLAGTKIWDGAKNEPSASNPLRRDFGRFGTCDSRTESNREPLICV
jgi:hypothetical protein